MGRNKIVVKKIQDARNRHVTFNKRKSGLVKKAMELSLLCDCEIGLIIFEGKPQDKLVEYSSIDDMDALMVRYSEYPAAPMQSVTNDDYEKLYVKKKEDGKEDEKDDGKDDGQTEETEETEEIEEIEDPTSSQETNYGGTERAPHHFIGLPENYNRGQYGQYGSGSSAMRNDSRARHQQVEQQQHDVIALMNRQLQYPIVVKNQQHQRQQQRQRHPQTQHQQHQQQQQQQQQQQPHLQQQLQQLQRFEQQNHLRQQNNEQPHHVMPLGLNLFNPTHLMQKGLLKNHPSSYPQFALDHPSVTVINNNDDDTASKHRISQLAKEVVSGAKSNPFQAAPKFTMQVGKTDGNQKGKESTTVGQGVPLSSSTFSSSSSSASSSLPLPPAAAAVESSKTKAGTKRSAPSPQEITTEDHTDNVKSSSGGGWSKKRRHL